MRLPSLLLLIGLFVGLAHLHAQSGSTTNLVLDLDGRDSCVELPPNLFTNEVVTVEGWVKWRTFGTYSRFFHFGSAAQHFSVHNRATTASLGFESFSRPPFDGLVIASVGDALREDEWHHIAVVAGADLLRLYLNGVLMATNTTPLNWSPDPPPPLRNFLGRSLVKNARNAGGNTDLDGQMDEVRLWAGERTETQIRDNLFKTLTGNEPGLLGYWNFDDGTARDRSPNGHHGKLLGAAKTTDAALPRPPTWRPMDVATISGRVTDSKGRPVADAELQLYEDGRPVANLRAATDLSGEYTLRFVIREGPYELRVAKGNLLHARTDTLLPEPRTNPWDFTLVETLLAGHLDTADKQPAAAVLVELLRDADESVTSTTLTDADGNFRFTIDTADRYRLSVATSQGRVPLNRDRPVTIALGTQMTGITFEVAPRGPLPPSPPPPNRVLNLGGVRQHARLPSRVFGGLGDATIEGWVKWERFTRRSRFFDFGRADFAMYVESGDPANPMLGFRVQTGQFNYGETYIEGVLRTNEWLHIAAVSGRLGMKLYLNGLLVGTSPYTGSFQSLGNNDNSHLGRSSWGADDFFPRADGRGARVGDGADAGTDSGEHVCAAHGP